MLLLLNKLKAEKSFISILGLLRAFQYRAALVSISSVSKSKLL